MSDTEEIDRIRDSDSQELVSGNQGPTGYLHPGYAESFIEFGIPRILPQCGGWVLERQIRGFSCNDAMGCYPLFVCDDWSVLNSDMKALDSEIVSLSLVTDPFGNYDKNYLSLCFKDVVIPFKDHYIIELNQAIKKTVSEHHRRYAKKALKYIRVERPAKPIDFIDEWVSLYDGLILHHDIKGIAAFSRSAFIGQLKVPGIVMFRAVYEETTIAIQLWYVQGNVGYYHLGASNAIGYKFYAAFALVKCAMEYFQDSGLQWLDLGGGAGVKNDGSDALSKFKRGWSNGIRTVFFCGRIFDYVRYAEIVNAKSIASHGYFPAYRKGEFA